MPEQQTERPLPLPVVVQPDPMLEEHSSMFRTTLVMLGSAFVVVLVLYGLSRPPERQEMAAAPQAPAGEAAPAPAGQQPPTAGSGQQEPAKQSGAQQPSTTGQGEAAAKSDSATTGKAPAAASDKPKPK